MQYGTKGVRAHRGFRRTDHLYYQATEEKYPGSDGAKRHYRRDIANYAGEKALRKTGLSGAVAMGSGLYVASLTTIDQLQDPKLAKLFDANGNGKADLSGCTASWGCEAVTNHYIKAYDLSTAAEHSQGNYAAIIVHAISRYNEGKPILYYTQIPHWVSYVLVPGCDVVQLQVPFSSLLGEQKGISTKLPNGADYGISVNSMRIVAYKQQAKANPAAAKLFAIMKLPIADINAQNVQMHQSKAQEAYIKRQTDGWIKAHQTLFDG